MKWKNQDAEKEKKDDKIMRTLRKRWRMTRRRERG
jgi:hypothetical protein